MEAGELVDFICGDLFEDSDSLYRNFGLRHFRFFDEGELGFLADAHVAMAEELAEFGNGAMRETFADEFLRFEHGGVAVQRGIVDAIDAAFAGLVPTSDPISNVEAAVDSEVAIRGEDFPDE